MHAIIAGSGFLGSKIAHLLMANDYDLTVVKRSPGELTGAKFVSCDLTMQIPEFYAPEYDLAVFCLAPGTRDEVRYERTYCLAQQNFLSAVRARQYIYISSTAVYPDTEGVYDETGADPHSSRARILLAAEQIAGAREACILRLAGLYSAERPIYRSTSAHYSEDKLVHFIHADDAARAVLHAAKNNLRGIYNVHDGNPQWRGEILHQLNLNKQQLGTGTRRRISCDKLAATYFNPTYPDYFAGVGLPGK